MLTKIDVLLSWFDSFWSIIDPNSITMFRLYLVPLAITLLLYGSLGSLALCLLVMIVIEISDRADGYVARKFNKTSDWGKLYDPMCDTVYHMSMYLALIYYFPSKLFVLAIAIILFREIRIAYLRAECASQGLVLAALPMGKAKVATQIVSIFLCVIWLVLQQLIGIGIISELWCYLCILSMVVTVAFSIISLLHYQSYAKAHLTHRSSSD